MKKIVITGPHCCGKSTIIKRIEDEICFKNNIEFVHFSGKNSPVDYSSSTKLKENAIYEIDITYYMINKLLEREIDLEYKNGDLAVLDRCLIDQIVYPSILMDKKYQNDIFNYIKLWLKFHPYEHVFYVPKNYELLEKYGTKDKSKEYLELIEKEYLEVLKKLDVNYTILPSDQDKQIEELKKYLIESKYKGN